MNIVSMPNRTPVALSPYDMKLWTAPVNELSPEMENGSPKTTRPISTRKTRASFIRMPSAIM